YTHEKFSLDQLATAINPAGTQVGTLLVTDDQDSTYSEYAAFADLTYHVTDRFDIQVGGRQGHNKVANVRGVLTGPLVGGVSVVPVTESTGDVFTYLVTPRFKISPNVMLYGRFASGYRPGGPNSLLAAANGAPPEFDPDKTENYEFGVKGDFFDHVLSVDA